MGSILICASGPPQIAGHPAPREPSLLNGRELSLANARSATKGPSHSGSPGRTRWVRGTGSGPWALLCPCSAVPRRSCLSEWGGGVHTCLGWCPRALWSLEDPGCPEVESVSVRASHSPGAKAEERACGVLARPQTELAPLGAASTHPPTLLLHPLLTVHWWEAGLSPADLSGS